VRQPHAPAAAACPGRNGGCATHCGRTRRGREGRILPVDETRSGPSLFPSQKKMLVGRALVGSERHWRAARPRSFSGVNPRGSSTVSFPFGTREGRMLPGRGADPVQGQGRPLFHGKAVSSSIQGKGSLRRKTVVFSQGAGRAGFFRMLQRSPGSGRGRASAPDGKTEIDGEDRRDQRFGYWGGDERQGKKFPAEAARTSPGRSAPSEISC